MKRCMDVLCWLCLLVELRKASLSLLPCLGIATAVPAGSLTKHGRLVRKEQSSVLQGLQEVGDANRDLRTAQSASMQTPPGSALL